jgi:hypothetical protein
MRAQGLSSGDPDIYKISKYITSETDIFAEAASGRTDSPRGGAMFTNKTRVLLILPQDVLDRARVLAGKSTTTFKLPVSLQIVLRALVQEGLRRDHYPRLHINIEEQAKAVRQLRSGGRRARPVGAAREDPSSAIKRRASGRAVQQRGK